MLVASGGAGGRENGTHDVAGLLFDHLWQKGFQYPEMGEGIDAECPTGDSCIRVSTQRMTEGNQLSDICRREIKN